MLTEARHRFRYDATEHAGISAPASLPSRPSSADKDADNLLPTKHTLVDDGVRNEAPRLRTASPLQYETGASHLVEAVSSAFIARRLSTLHSSPSVAPALPESPGKGMHAPREEEHSLASVAAAGTADPRTEEGTMEDYLNWLELQQSIPDTASSFAAL
jgi:hypothetical protein